MLGLRGLSINQLAPNSSLGGALQTNFLVTHLEQDSTMPIHGPLYSHIMMPTHQYNRRTLLMMQNLHNNYLYNANTGIIFTRRGWNGSMLPHPHFKGTIKDSDSLNAVEVRIGTAGELDVSTVTKCDPVIKDSSGVMQSSILGEPINIQNFINGAKMSQL
jgi:hypothetical protein